MNNLNFESIWKIDEIKIIGNEDENFGKKKLWQKYFEMLKIKFSNKNFKNHQKNLNLN